MSGQLEQYEQIERFDKWTFDVGVDVCERCGALVQDINWHFEWHRRIIEAASK